MKTAKRFIKLFAILAALLGCAAAAHAQALVANPTSLTFTSTGTPFQSITITSNAGAVTYVAATSSSPNWLSISPTQVTTAATSANFIVQVNSAGLTASTYTGSVTITASNGSSVVIPVTFTVSGGSSTSQLTSSPASLTFNSAAGSVPASQTITVGTTTGATGIGFSAIGSVLNGGTNWLTVVQNGATAAGGTVTVSVNPANLLAGTYNGVVTLTQAGGGQLTVPVTFGVNTTAQLAVSTNALNFVYQTGAAAPAQQTISVTSGGVPVAFTATPNTTSGINWLIVSPPNGVTPGDLVVGINSNLLTQLPPNTYTGTVTIASAAGTQTVQVTFTITVSPVLLPAPGALTFNYQPGAALPAAQNVSLATSGTSVPFIAFADQSWISISPATGTATGTAQSIAISIGQTAPTAPGTYTGKVTFAPNGVTGSPNVQVQVTLNVSNTPAIVIGAQNPLVFNYQTGRLAPPPQTVQITSSTGIPLTAAVQPSSTGNWLIVDRTYITTPSPVLISVNPTGLAKGTYDGSITITPIGTSGIPAQTLNVKLNVSDTPLMNASPSAITFYVAQNQTSIPVNQTISLTSTGTNAGDPILNFTASATTASGASGWLAISPLSGAIPASVYVTALPFNLPVGTYTGTITLNATGANSAAANTITIPVNLVITAGSLKLDTTSIAFTASLGGQNPAAKTVRVTSDPAGTNLPFTTSVSTTIGFNWLKVSPSSGTTPADVQISVDTAGLGQGTYLGSVTIASPNTQSQTVQVQLTVGAPQTVSVSPSALSFSYQISGQAPAAQKISVGASGGSLNFTATAATSSGGAGWLTVSPASGTAPQDVNVSVNPANLNPGTYNGTVTIAAPNATNTPQVVSVTLTVSRPKPILTSVSNAASYAFGQVVPGEIVYLKGQTLGPTNLITYRIENNQFVTKLATTRVLFDGIPAPLVYVLADQASAIVPNEVGGRLSSRVQVEVDGVLSDPLDYQVRDAAPGLFTINQRGDGQGAILNQNFSVNGGANPAAKGSVIMIYATGAGLVSPPQSNGAVVPLTPPFPQHPLGVTVTIGGRQVDVQYQGAAPGLVSGLTQINAVIPPDMPSGVYQVLVKVGAATSQPGVTVAVQ